MTFPQRLRSLADRTGLDGFAEELRALASDMEESHWTEHEPVRLAEHRTDWVYVAGPMTGIADLNFPAFNAAAARLREDGKKVINPVDHGIVDGAQWGDYLRHDIAGLVSCERTHLLPGWSASNGANLEVLNSLVLGNQITLEPGAEPVKPAAVLEFLGKRLGAVLGGIGHITDEQILLAAEPFGEFQRGDAQGHARIAFARAILALRPAAQPVPAGYLMHWPAPGGGRDVLWSETGAEGRAIGCPVEQVFKFAEAQPASAPAADTLHLSEFVRTINALVEGEALPESSIELLRSIMAAPAAQPVGEPVAIGTLTVVVGQVSGLYLSDRGRSLPEGKHTLYTHAQPAHEPMTDDQIRSMCKQGWVFETVKQWVRVIEAHHKIGGAA